MYSLSRLLGGFSVAGLLLCAQGAAAQVEPPPSEGQAYIVSFVDVRVDRIDSALETLREYRHAGLEDDANLELDIFQEIGQTNRFMVTEVWREEANYTQFSTSPSSVEIGDALSDDLLAPPDTRIHRVFSEDGPADTLADASLGADAVYVQTHLDVAPPLFESLNAMLTPFVAASSDEGGLVYLNLYQHIAPRQNHLTLLEAWRNEEALNAHRTAPHTLEFRREIFPILGSLYDERLYRLVD